MSKAVVLCSGGLDSVAALYLAHASRSVHVLTIDYGQSHAREKEYARRHAERLKVPWHCATVRLDGWEGALLNGGAPLDRSAESRRVYGVAPTFLPGRNLIFLTLADALAIQVGAEEIWIGCNVEDAAGYPDCRGFFFAEARGVCRARIVTPWLYESKRDVLNRIHREGWFDPLDTWSCYLGGMEPCGRCDACLLRKEAGA